MSGVVLPAVLIPIAILLVSVGCFLLYRRRRIARRRREVADLNGHGSKRPFSPLVSFGTSFQPSQSQQANPRMLESPAVPQPLPVMTLEIRRPVSYATSIGDSELPRGLESVAPSSPTQTFTEPATPHRHSMAVSTIAPTIASSRPVSADFRIFRAPSSVTDVPPVPALPRLHTEQFFTTEEVCGEHEGECDCDLNGERAPQLRALSPVSTFGGTTLHGHTRHSTDSSYAVRWTPALGPEDVPPVPPLPSAVPLSPDTMMSPVGTFGMRESAAPPISRSISLSASESLSRASESSRKRRSLPRATGQARDHTRPPLPTIPSATASPLEFSSDQSDVAEHPSPYRLSLDQQVEIRRPAPTQPPTRRASPPQLLRRLTVDTVSAAAASGSTTVVTASGPSSAPVNRQYGASGSQYSPALTRRVEDDDDEYILAGELHDDLVPMTALSPSPFPHDAPPKPRKRRTLLLERRERRLRLALADKAVASAVTASAPMSLPPAAQVASPNDRNSPSIGSESPGGLGGRSPSLFRRGGHPSPSADSVSRYSQMTAQSHPY